LCALQSEPVFSSIEIDQIVRGSFGYCREESFTSPLWTAIGHGTSFVTYISTHKFTVFIVDDDRAVLESLRFLLETSGIDVRTFRSGAALLGQVASGHADCFVIDYKMASMNGIELTSRLHERNILTPVILVTGYPDSEMESKAAAAGIRDVLFKPHLDDSLVKRILQVIRPATDVARDLSKTT
jgi:two-component system response regulator FixJ